MTQHTISFSLDIHVGDSTLQEAVSGSIEVNLCVNPEDDEINRWNVTALLRLPQFATDKMERLAIEEARQQLAADRGEQQIDQPDR